MNLSLIMKWTIFLVGLHSIILGLTIYFATVPFYHFFFEVEPANPFFVKQSGVFLFLIGLFYLAPLVDFEKHNNLILLIVFSKITAVLFLLINDHLTPAPSMILLAAAGDALMAAAISLLIFLCYKKRVPPFNFQLIENEDFKKRK